MATIKVKFRPSTVEGREGVLFYRIIRNRTARPIRTGYRLLPQEWNDRTRRILLPPTGERRRYLADLQERIDRDVERLEQTMKRLERQNPDYTHEELAAAFDTPPTGFFELMHETIARLHEHGRLRTAETYDTTLRSFTRFRGGRNLQPDEMTADVTAAYETWLRETGVCKNTSSFYMRILRAAYNLSLIHISEPTRRTQ